MLDPGLFVRERKRQGMTDDELAARSAIPLYRMQELEGGAAPSANEVVAIAKALRVKPQDIDKVWEVTPWQRS